MCAPWSREGWLAVVVSKTHFREAHVLVALVW